MAIETYSKFYFGYEVTGDNNFFPFDEGTGEILGELNVGYYSLEDFIVEIVRAMNVITGITNNYTSTVDRTTRQITITGDANFDILSNSSLLNGVSIFSIAGFSLATDKVGANSYEGESAGGQEYQVQFKLQKYIDFDFDQRSASASVNESATGVFETITYGKIKSMSCNITLITSRDQGAIGAIRNNPTGTQDALRFMEEIVKKGNIEFIPDEDNPNDFTKCVLESTSKSTKGIDFILKELISKKLNGYYETGTLKFRKV